MAPDRVTGCLRCKAPTNLFLCNDCVRTLQDMLTDLPWLLDQLDTTVQRQDKLSAGAVGRTSDNPSPINFGAMETARETRKALQQIVIDLATAHTGRTPPHLDTVTTGDLARWLCANVTAIAKQNDALRYYRIVEHLGAEDTPQGRPGPLWQAINRTDRRFAGPCPTLRGHKRNGERIECGTILYADTEEAFVRCPTCDTEIDVAKNRLKAAVDRDLLPEAKLLEVLADLGEKVSRVKLYDWIKAGRLQRRGWVHQGAIVQYRIRRGDPTVFSLSQARQLRWHEQEAKQKHAHA